MYLHIKWTTDINELLAFCCCLVFGSSKWTLYSLLNICISFHVSCFIKYYCRYLILVFWMCLMSYCVLSLVASIVDIWMIGCFFCWCFMFIQSIYGLKILKLKKRKNSKRIMLKYTSKKLDFNEDFFLFCFFFYPFIYIHAGDFVISNNTCWQSANFRHSILYKQYIN